MSKPIPIFYNALLLTSVNLLLRLVGILSVDGINILLC